HNDKQTPHMHLGVVPMRDGKLQGRNVFNRQELLWLQDKFPEHMKKQGFELKRGERGYDRKHIETAKFKKQTLEKEIDFLEKNLAVKKDEWTAYSDKVKSDLEVPAKRHMKNVEVPTGDKKSTRLNSSHVSISYAVFCLKKKTVKENLDYYM